MNSPIKMALLILLCYFEVSLNALSAQHEDPNIYPQFYVDSVLISYPGVKEVKVSQKGKPGRYVISEDGKHVTYYWGKHKRWEKWYDERQRWTRYDYYDYKSHQLSSVHRRSFPAPDRVESEIISYSVVQKWDSAHVVNYLDRSDGKRWEESTYYFGDSVRNNLYYMQYQFDDAGRPVSIKFSPDDPEHSVTRTYVYEKGMVSVHRPLGVRDLYMDHVTNYDEQGRMTRHETSNKFGSGYSYDYEYDENGRLLQVTENSGPRTPFDKDTKRVSKYRYKFYK